MKMMMYLATIILIINILYLTSKIVCVEDEEETPDIFSVNATAYCTDEKGTRNGIVAGKPEWGGKVVAIYKNDNGEIGDFIGYYECLETESNMKVIEIFNPSKKWCAEFGTQKVFIHLIDGKG